MEVDGGLSEAASPSTEVVRRVASEAGVDPIDLPPLYEAVDPDALDRFLESVDGTTPTVSEAVRFRYAGYHVAVEADGAVALSPLE
jgi:hypothetical protein